MDPIKFAYWFVLSKGLNWLFKKLPVSNRFSLKIVLWLGHAKRRIDELLKQDYDK